MTKLVGWTADDEDEVFVPCPDYPAYFEVGSKGSLRSLRTGKLVSQTPDHKGYLRHATKIGGRNGKDVCIRVHVQVAKAFVPRESDDLQVNHLLGIKDANRYDQLEWATGSANMQHAVESGLVAPKKGEDNHNSRLTQEQADEIRSFEGSVSQRELGRRYGVSKDTIGKILRNETYVG